MSLDGPKEIHDTWRKDTNNGGSFERTIRGIKILCESYRNDSHKLGLSMVYCPPYSEKKVEIISNFLTSTGWIPNDIRINITYPTEGTISNEFYKNKMKINGRSIDQSLSNWARKRFINDYKRNVKSHPIANSILEKKFAKFIQRPLFKNPIKITQLNGCCIPGARKNYITAKGNMKICERIGNAPELGNIKNGINYEIIKESYIDEYSEKSIGNCSKCWLVNLCPLCYQHTFHNNEINIMKKNMYCFLQKIEERKNLEDFCSLLEIDDKGLDYLYEWQIS